MPNDHSIRIELSEDDSFPVWFEYRGFAYELKWDHTTLVRITRHAQDGQSRDIRWDDLPEPIKKLIVV